MNDARWTWIQPDGVVQIEWATVSLADWKLTQRRQWCILDSMKSVPIAAAKRIADEFGKDQVIVLCFSRADGKTWVTTYGRTVSDCEQAAEGGNRMKRVMGWPEELCNAQPARAKKAKSKSE